MIWTIIKRTCLWLLSSLAVVLSCVLLLVLAVFNYEPLSLWALSRGAQLGSEAADMAVDYRRAWGTLSRGFVIEDLRVSLPEDGGDISVAQLELRWDLWLLLQRQLRVRHAEFSGITIDLPAAEPSPLVEDEEPLAVADILETVFTLPLSLRVDRFLVNDLQLRQEALEVDLQHLGLSARLSERGAVLQNLELVYDPLTLKAAMIRLNPDHGLEAGIEWQLEVDLDEDRQLPLSGSLAVSGSLETVELRHALAQPLPLVTEGWVQTGLFPEFPLQFSLRHQLNPLRPAALEHLAELADLSMLESISLLLEMTGDDDAVDLTLAVDASIESLGDVVLRSSADVVLEPLSVNLSAFSVQSPYGELLAQGRSSPLAEDLLDLNWSFQSDSIPNLPDGVSVSQLLGEGTVALRGDDDDLSVAARIHSVTGLINDYPLMLEAEADVLNDALTRLQLVLDAAGNHLRVQGSMAEVLDVSWALEATALEALMPGLSGQVQGSGQVSGSLDSPDIALTLSGEALGWQQDERQLNLSQLRLDAEWQDSNSAVFLLLEDGRFQQEGLDERLAQLAFTLSGRPDAHEGELDVQSDLATLHLSLAGQLENSAWAGTLGAVRLTTDYGELALQEPLAVAASAEQVVLSPHCWGIHGVSLCLDGEWQAEGETRMDLALGGLNLAYLTVDDVLELIDHEPLRAALESRPTSLSELQDSLGIYAPDNIYMLGDLALNASFRAPSDALADSFSLQMELTPTEILLGIVNIPSPESSVQDMEQREFALRVERLAAWHEGGQWQSELLLDVHDQTEQELALQGRLESRVGMDGDGALSGTVDLDFQDLAFIESLVPVVSESRGSLEMEAVLAGDLQRPLLNTRVSLRDGGLRVPEYGLHLQDLSLSLSSDDDNNFSYALSAVSGPGTLTVDGVLRHPFLEDTRAVELTVRGEDFRVIEQPGLIADISPDLQLRYTAQGLRFSGQLLLPTLDIIVDQAIDTSGATAINVSRDIVIYDIDDDGERQQADTALPVQGRLTVRLGEGVRLRAYGLDMRLEGQVALEQSPHRPVLVYGEVGVHDGFYEMYGQRLDVERGQLLFLGNPMNPALEIRASRRVDMATVGIQMNGTLNNIQSRLYSVPILPEGEILAMLVTGRSFGNSEPMDNDRLLATIANLGIERGQGITSAIQSGLGVDTLEVSGGTNLEDSSLGVGKYLTPELFVRYDVGLFDRESIISMMYSLTERIRVEVQSGIRQSVDITYTLER